MSASIPAVLRNPAGKFSWLKTVTLVLTILPGAWIAWRWGTVGLGPRGVNAAMHLTGTWAVRFLLISLAVTPARFVLDTPRVLWLRRMLGVTAAVYAGIHFSLYVVDNQGDLLHVAAEIALRFYLTIGFVALLGLLALAATSTDVMQRRLGRNWKRLHKLVYPIAVLAIFHHFLQAKADVSTAVFAAGVFFWLMFWRLKPAEWRTWRWPLLALAALAGLGAVAIEALWYGTTTGISGWRVLAANLNVSRGLRPGEWVGVAGLIVLALSFTRPLWRPKPSKRRRAGGLRESASAESAT